MGHKCRQKRFKIGRNTNFGEAIDSSFVRIPSLFNTQACFIAKYGLICKLLLRWISISKHFTLDFPPGTLLMYGLMDISIHIYSKAMRIQNERSNTDFMYYVNTNLSIVKCITDNFFYQRTVKSPN